MYFSNLCLTKQKLGGDVLSCIRFLFLVVRKSLSLLPAGCWTPSQTYLGMYRKSVCAFVWLPSAVVQGDVTAVPAASSTPNSLMRV